MVKQDKVTSKKEKSVAKKNPVESLENDQLFTLTSGKLNLIQKPLKMLIYLKAKGSILMRKSLEKS